MSKIYVNNAINSGVEMLRRSFITIQYYAANNGKRYVH